MKFLSRMRDRLGRTAVGHQLGAAFAIVLVLTAVVGGVALHGLTDVNAQADALSGKWLKGVGVLADARMAFVESRENEVKHSRTADTSYHSEYEDKIAETTKVITPALAAYEGLLTSDAERALFAKFSRGLNAYRQSQQRVIALGRDKKRQDAADVSDGAGSMAFDGALGALDALTKYGFEGGKTAAAQTAAVYAATQRTMLALLAAALLLGAGLAYAITRHLIGQLGGEPGTAADVAKAAADVDPRENGRHRKLDGQARGDATGIGTGRDECSAGIGERGHGERPDRPGQPGSVEPHRAAGQRASTDGDDDG